MRILIAAIICCLTLFVYQSPAQKPNTASRTSPASQTGTQSVANKIEGFLKESGAYTRHKEGVWTVDYKGESIGSFKLFVLTDESGLLIMAAQLAKKDNVRISQDLLLNLLKYNHKADYVKLAIDQEGNFVVRADTNGVLINLQQFKDLMQQTTAAANETYAMMSGFLVTSAK